MVVVNEYMLLIFAVTEYVRDGEVLVESVTAWAMLVVMGGVLLGRGNGDILARVEMRMWRRWAGVNVGTVVAEVLTLMLVVVVVLVS